MRLRGGSDIGFADNFDQRDSTAIQVDGCTFAGIRKPLVQALTRVLFEMQAGDADVLSSGCGRNLDLAKLCQGLVVLRNLIALGQIGIKIILARENGCLVNSAAQRHRRQHREIYRLAIQYWQRSGKAKAYRANVSIWWIAKARRARAENLCSPSKAGRALPSRSPAHTWRGPLQRFPASWPYQGIIKAFHAAGTTTLHVD